MSLPHLSVNDSSEAISEVLETSGAVILDDAGSSEAPTEAIRVGWVCSSLLPQLAAPGGKPVPLLSAVDRVRSGPGAPRSDGVFERWLRSRFLLAALGAGGGAGACLAGGAFRRAGISGRAGKDSGRSHRLEQVGCCGVKTI